MARKQKKSSILDGDALPELQHGVPGVQWLSDHPQGNAKSQKPKMPDDTKESYVLYVSMIFGIALVLRLLMVMMGPLTDVERAYTPATAVQMELADNLVQERAFGRESQTPGTAAAAVDALRMDRGEMAPIDGTTLQAEFYESPGYPSVLALLKFTGLDASWLLLTQCLLGAACCVLTYFVGLAILGRKTPAAIASVLVAIHPAMITASGTLSGTVIVTALVLLGLVGIANLEKRSFKTVAGGGIALGTASLFSPGMVWLLPILGIWTVVAERRLRSIGLALTLLLGGALPVGGWMYRNTQHGVDPWVNVPLAMQRLFGTAEAMQGELGEAAGQPDGKVMTEFRAALSNEDEHTPTVFEAVDAAGRTLVTQDPRALLDLAGQTSLQTGIDHSLDEAYARLGIEYVPAGYAAARLGEPVGTMTPTDGVTEWVINVWVGFNAAILAAMAVGAVLMIWRRRFAGLLLMVGVMGVVAWLSTAGPSETLRLPVLALQGLMIAAVFAPGPIKVAKPEQAKKKMSKIKKLSDDDLNQPALGGMGSGEISLKDAPHPALAMARPLSEDRSESASKAPAVAMSGRPI